MAYAYKRVDTPTELEITEEAFFSEKSLLSSVDRLDMVIMCWQVLLDFPIR